jgi:hypothetical protein
LPGCSPSRHRDRWRACRRRRCGSCSGGSPADLSRRKPHLAPGRLAGGVRPGHLVRARDRGSGRAQLLGRRGSSGRRAARGVGVSGSEGPVLWDGRGRLWDDVPGEADRRVERHAPVLRALRRPDRARTGGAGEGVHAVRHAPLPSPEPGAHSPRPGRKPDSPRPLAGLSGGHVQLAARFRRARRIHRGGRKAGVDTARRPACSTTPP